MSKRHQDSGSHLDLNCPDPKRYQSAPTFPFEQLFGELQFEVLRLGSVSARVLLGLTCRKLFDHPNRPTLALQTFARSVCIEGLNELVPFVSSIERTNLSLFIFDGAALAAIAQRNDEKLMLTIRKLYRTYQNQRKALNRWNPPEPFNPENGVDLGLAIRIAAELGHSALLVTLKSMCDDQQQRADCFELEGVMSSANVERICDLDIARFPLPMQLQYAIKHAPLAIVQLLSSSTPLAPSMCLASESPDLSVLQWCCQSGLQGIHFATLLDGSLKKDRLQTFLYLLEKSGRGQLDEYVMGAFKYGSWRILSHLLDVDKIFFTELLRHKHFVEGNYIGFFDNAPSYRDALEFFIRAGLVEKIKPPFVPELSYLQLLVQLGANPANFNLRSFVDRWLEPRWLPRAERSALWLLDNGAVPTSDWVTTAASPKFRPQFFQMLIDRGSPTFGFFLYSSLMESKDSSIDEIAERCCVVRARLPLPGKIDIGLIYKLFPSTKMPPTLLAEMLGKHGERLSSNLHLLFNGTLQKSELEARLQAFGPVLEDRQLPSSLFLQTATFSWAGAIRDHSADPLETIINLFNLLLKVDCKLPTWRQLITHLCGDIGARVGQLTEHFYVELLNWFVPHLGPLTDDRETLLQAMAHSLRAIDGRTKLRTIYSAKLRGICTFLRTQHLQITDKDITAEAKLRNIALKPLY